MSSPGTTHKLIRSLAHTLPPVKGSKFANSRTPTQHRHRAKFVKAQDRIPFWNITIGDRVRLRRGKAIPDLNEEGQTEGKDGDKSAKVRPEGIVVSVDREKNWLWLRDVDEQTRLSPKQLRHIQPRLVDPEDPEKGYGPNVMEIPKAVHYSQCRLVVPGKEDSPAVRLSRSEPYYNKALKAFQWKRFAVIKKPDGTREKIEVPWPKGVEVRKEPNSTTSLKSLVSLSTFLPWDPSNPINLSSSKSRFSPQSLLRATESLRQSRVDKELARKSNSSVGGYAPHEGIKQKTVKPPPIPQAPSEDEKVWMRNLELKSWYGGLKGVEKSFIGEDYLGLAPNDGPWSDISKTGHHSQNQEVSSTQIPQKLFTSIFKNHGLESFSSLKRNPKSMKLLNQPTSLEIDEMPIELMMKNDLTNQKGLKWRMKNWNEKMERKSRALERKKTEDGEKLKELREEVLGGSQGLERTI